MMIAGFDTTGIEKKIAAFEHRYNIADSIEAFIELLNNSVVEE